MTTVVYDKNILAADSRTTHGHTEHTCVVCDNKSRRYSDKSNKIHVDFKDVTFRGQKVLAAAGAGMTIAVGDLISALRQKEGLERAYKLFRSFTSSHAAPAIIMIVTENNVFVAEEEHSTSKELTVREFKRTDRVAIGSGAKAAEMAMELTDCGATTAVKLAMAVDDGTGGPITHVDLSAKGELRTVKTDAIAAKEAVKAHRAIYESGKKGAILTKPKPPVATVSAAAKKPAVKRTPKTIKK